MLNNLKLQLIRWSHLGLVSGQTYWTNASVFDNKGMRFNILHTESSKRQASVIFTAHALLYPDALGIQPTPYASLAKACAHVSFQTNVVYATMIKLKHKTLVIFGEDETPSPLGLDQRMICDLWFQTGHELRSSGWRSCVWPKRRLIAGTLKPFASTLNATKTNKQTKKPHTCI